jgi:hypothetical protein
LWRRVRALAFCATVFPGLHPRPSYFGVSAQWVAVARGGGVLRGADLHIVGF